MTTRGPYTRIHAYLAGLDVACEPSTVAGSVSKRELAAAVEHASRVRGDRERARLNRSQLPALMPKPSCDG